MTRKECQDTTDCGTFQQQRLISRHLCPVGQLPPGSTVALRFSYKEKCVLPVTCRLARTTDCRRQTRRRDG